MRRGRTREQLYRDHCIDWAAALRKASLYAQDAAKGFGTAADAAGDLSKAWGTKR